MTSHFNPCCPGYLRDKTPREAWDQCENGARMLRAYKDLHPDNLKELTLAKGHIAASVLHLMKDKRSRKAVEVAIAFGEGKATREELDKAQVAAEIGIFIARKGIYLCHIYAATAASTAACAAAYAAYAEYSSTYDITLDKDKARTAEADSLKQSADICRKYLTETMFTATKRDTQP